MPSSLHLGHWGASECGFSGMIARSVGVVVYYGKRRETPAESPKLSRKDTSMRPAPREIGGARVISYSPIDKRHHHTGNCRQIVAGVLQGPMAGLAICQYPGEDSYFLFGCDTEWQSITDTWHQTLEQAKQQAEFEYEGVSSTWQKHE